MVFKNLCILVLWTKVASALEGLSIIDVDKIVYGITVYSCCLVEAMAGARELAN